MTFEDTFSKACQKGLSLGFRKSEGRFVRIFAKLRRQIVARLGITESGYELYIWSSFAGDAKSRGRYLA
jgi:hypothetical protein